MKPDPTTEERAREHFPILSALDLANKIGDELDNTPHANNAEYVAHFERLMVEHVSAAITSAVEAERAWRTRETMPTDDVFLAAWLDGGEIERVEFLANTRHDGKWLNRNTGNYIADTWTLWAPLPAPPRKEKDLK